MRSTIPRAAVLLATAAIAGCVRAPQPAPAPQPVAVPTPVAVPSRAAAGSDWRDWPVTPGDWAYRIDGRGTIALFGPAGGDALLTLRCDRQANVLYLSRQGAGAAPLTVRTSSITRVLPVQPTGGLPAYGATALAPRDALLDAVAFSRGRFVVEQAGAATLVIPAWAEIARTVEDCR